MESILTSIKKMLGIAEEYTLRCGPYMHQFCICNSNPNWCWSSEGFSIEDELSVWETLFQKIKMGINKVLYVHEGKTSFRSSP